MIITKPTTTLLFFTIAVVLEANFLWCGESKAASFIPPTAAQPNNLQKKIAADTMLTDEEIAQLPEFLRTFKRIVRDAIAERMSRSSTKKSQEEYQEFMGQLLTRKFCSWVKATKKSKKGFLFKQTMKYDLESKVDQQLQQLWVAAQKKLNIPDAQQLPIGFYTCERNVPPWIATPIASIDYNQLSINPHAFSLQERPFLTFVLLHEADHLRGHSPAIYEIFGKPFTIKTPEATIEINGASRKEQEQFRIFREAHADETAYRALECYECIQSVIDARYRAPTAPDYFKELGYFDKKKAKSIADEFEAANRLCPTHARQRQKYSCCFL